MHPYHMHLHASVCIQVHPSRICIHQYPFTRSIYLCKCQYRHISPKCQKVKQSNSRMSVHGATAHERKEYDRIRDRSEMPDKTYKVRH